MTRLLTAAVLILTACDRSESNDTATSKAQLADARATCVQLFQRQRGCTDQFIPALVDLRRELDVPSGIAKAPRAELLVTAHEEWRSDSTDEAISTQCDRMAPSLPAAAVTEARGCLSKSACGDFVTCVLPLMRQQLSK